MARRLVLATIPALLVACAAPRTPARHPASVPPATGAEHRGLASWYGQAHHGRRTASGEIYDMHGLTAAHRTLPFGTWLRVENLTNGRSVDVRVNDRGPVVDGRIIDLSYAAAAALGAVGAGLVRVRFRVIDAPPDARR